MCVSYATRRPIISSLSQKWQNLTAEVNFSLHACTKNQSFYFLQKEGDQKNPLGLRGPSVDDVFKTYSVVIVSQKSADSSYLYETSSSNTIRRISLDFIQDTFAPDDVH